MYNLYNVASLSPTLLCHSPRPTLKYGEVSRFLEKSCPVSDRTVNFPAKQVHFHFFTFSFYWCPIGKGPGKLSANLIVKKVFKTSITTAFGEQNARAACALKASWNLSLFFLTPCYRPKLDWFYKEWLYLAVTCAHLTNNTPACTHFQLEVVWLSGRVLVFRLKVQPSTSSHAAGLSLNF